VHRLNQEVSGLLAQNLECTVAAEQLVLGIRDARVQMYRFVDAGDEGRLRAVVTIEQKTSQQLRQAGQTATTDKVRALIGETRRNHDQFFAEFTVMLRDMPAAARQQEVRELTDAITTNVLSSAERLLDETQRAAAQHTERNRTLADNIGLGLLALGACGAVGGLMAGFGIARGIARRIEQSEREATRSEQLAAIGQLAAGLAHELRNPLTAMRVLVEAGREQVASGGGLDRRDLEVLDEEIARLEKLVESFLDFARPPKLEKTTLDARKLIDQALHLVSGPARQHGVTIDWRPPTEAVSIEADAVQIRQVLLNLLLNAMDAVGEGGKVTVDVGQLRNLPEATLAKDRWEGIQLHETYATIHVADTGPGVPDEMKDDIFEPFISSKETGLGLGLAVSHRIVEAHGGTILVADNPGGGARFTIYLPHSDKRPACTPS
jgi:signal transduction histidine kinase